MRAAERVEHEELEPLAHVSRDLLVAEARDEFGDLAGMDVVGAGMLCHRLALMREGRTRRHARRPGRRPKSRQPGVRLSTVAPRSTP